MVEPAIPTRMGVGEARQFRKTATLHTASIKRRLRELPGQCKLRTAARRLAHPASTTALPWVKPQTATSTRRRTAKPTAIPAAVGVKRAEVRTARQVTTNLVLAVGEGRKRAAAHRPLTVEAVAGNPGRKVLVARQVWAVAAAGVVAGDSNAHGAAANEMKSVVLMKRL